MTEKNQTEIALSEQQSATEGSEEKIAVAGETVAQSDEKESDGNECVNGNDGEKQVETGEKTKEERADFAEDGNPGCGAKGESEACGEKELYTEKKENVRSGDKENPTNGGRIDAEEFFAAYFKAVKESESLREQLAEAKQSANFSEMLKNPENAVIAAQNEAVEKRVIENYLKKISRGRAVEVVGGNMGATPVSEKVVPKTLKEAKIMAEMLFRS